MASSQALEIVGAGTAQFFTAMINSSTASKATRYSANNTVYHLIMGTLGLQGSGADHEISDTNVTFESTIQLGTFKHTF